MPTEPQSITVSLEWARKLKEAGYSQDGCTFYVDRKSGLVSLGDPHREGESLTLWLERFIACPVAEEILRRLPNALLIAHGRHADFAITKTSHDWTVRYFAPMEELSDFDRTEDIRARKAAYFGFDKKEIADTLANAAAAMYCYLSFSNLL